MKYWSTAFLLTFSMTVLAQDMVIYRWVDENNVVHFSQNQPPVGDYTEIFMANAHKANLNIPKKQNEIETQSANVNDDSNISENLTVDAKSKCEEAKKNLATLTDFDRIRFVDSKGETQILDEAEQKEQITINQKRVDIFCKSSSASN